MTRIHTDKKPRRAKKRRAEEELVGAPQFPVSLRLGWLSVLQTFQSFAACKDFERVAERQGLLLFWAKPLVIVAWGITPGTERKSILVFWAQAILTLPATATRLPVSRRRRLNMAFTQKTTRLFLSVPGVIPQATMTMGFAQTRGKPALGRKSVTLRSWLAALPRQVYPCHPWLLFFASLFSVRCHSWFSFLSA
jgi:hypothetical protein